MREILFRGKRLDNGEWIYGGYQFEHGFGNPSHYIVEYSTFGAFTVNNLIKVYSDTVGQFTGLFDGAGKEIYDGDILQDDDGHLWVVSYSKGDAMFQISDGTVAENFGNVSSIWFMIVGNINEDTELLK